MALKCAYGHDVNSETNTCSDGHPPKEDIAVANNMEKLIADAIQSALVTFTHNVATQATQQQQQQQHNISAEDLPNTRKPVRPKLELNCNEGQWSFFEFEWKRYKRQARLRDADIRDDMF